MIDIEAELRQGKIFAAKSGVIDLNDYVEDLDLDEELEMVGYLSLGLTDSRRVEAKAVKDAEKLVEEMGFTGEFAEVTYDVELKHRLIFWAVVYGITVGGKPAIQHIPEGQSVELGVEYMKNFVEYRLGQFKQAYDALGLKILEDSGMSYLLPCEAEEDESDTSDNLSVVNS